MSMGRLWKVILIELDETVGSVPLPATTLDKGSARRGCFISRSFFDSPTAGRLKLLFLVRRNDHEKKCDKRKGGEDLVAW